tara:strand:+ start:127 stop:489 length:363 start_codon:yes stop_codon:yes gene_type:complete
LSNKNIIKLEKINFFGFHGVNKDEIKNGQNFVLDIVIHYEAIQKTDNLDDFIDYIDLYDLVKCSFEEKRFNLLESLISKILKDIKEKYKTVFYIKINIRKPSIAIDDNKDFINIEAEYKK